MFMRKLLQALATHQRYHLLSKTIELVLCMPISQRKTIISACQVGFVDTHDFRGFTVPLLPGSQPHERLQIVDFINNLRTIVSDNLQSSILWIAARSCPEPADNDEHQEIAKEGFFKEIQASQTLFNEHQVVSYSGFFGHEPTVDQLGAYWDTTCAEIRSGIHRRLHGKTLYPSVNRTKNVSDETTRIFRIHSAIDYVRSVDLEVFYHRTGYQIGGTCEMRQAWKFNDLKPRMYYCMGGEQYWSCRYMKTIAVAVMESIPSTFMKLRSSPHDFIRKFSESSYVTTWDFASFTTTLSELKHFLWSIARVCEGNKTMCTLFDYRDGFHDVEIWRLIDEYNEVANMNAPFSIHRMVGEFIETFEVDLYQMNSGMLGIHGNIGFSTALHGYVLTKACGKLHGVCVGDDALGITVDPPTQNLIPAHELIGVLHPTKFGILLPQQTQTTGHYLKFLKRRLEVVGTHLVISTLFDFPLPPYVDGEIGFRTPPPNFQLRDRIFKIATSASSLMWSLFGSESHIDEPESISIVFIYLRAAYRYLGLPFHGVLPGYTLFTGTSDEFTVDGFVLPDISEMFDLSREDWLTRMLERTSFRYYRGPVRTPFSDSPILLSGGETCDVSESPWLSAMEDLEYVKTEKVMEWYDLGVWRNKQDLINFVRGINQEGMANMVSVTCLRDIPLRFLRSTAVTGERHTLDDTEEI